MPSHDNHIHTACLLRAPRDQVWHAFSDATQFGTYPRGEDVVSPRQRITRHAAR